MISQGYWSPALHPSRLGAAPEWDSPHHRPFGVFDNSPRLKPGDSCFIGACQVGRSPRGSCRLSTAVHREPHGKDVLRSVDLPVVPDTAPRIRADPLAHVPRQHLVDVAASMAPLRTVIPAINLNQRAPIPRRLVLQLAHYLTPANVADALGQLQIANHVLDGQ